MIVLYRIFGRPEEEVIAGETKLDQVASFQLSVTRVSTFT